MLRWTTMSSWSLREASPFIVPCEPGGDRVPGTRWYQMAITGLRFTFVTAEAAPREVGLDLNMARQVFNQLSDSNLRVTFLVFTCTFCWLVVCNFMFHPFRDDFHTIWPFFSTGLNRQPVLLFCWFMMFFWCAQIGEPPELKDRWCSGILSFSWTRPLCHTAKASCVCFTSSCLSI